MTTRTQWVRNMADSHLNRSMLQRLSLMWPRTSARRDRRSPVPADSDGPEFFAPRLCQLGCGTPGRSVERFVDSPNWDYVASFRRPHERVPSSQAALRPPGPLRTGRESFPSPSSSPSNASLKETRFRNGKTLTMNPVMALWMK